MQKMVIYHSPCTDGWAASWLFKRAYPDAELVPAAYGDAPPDVRGKDVYVVDFSYPRAEMLRMFQQADGKVTVLDHHASARDALAGICEECSTSLSGLSAIPKVEFDMRRSGAMMALDYLNQIGATSGWDVPAVLALVSYIQDRDMWWWKLPESREVSAAIRSLPQTVEVWNDLVYADLDQIVAEGTAILRDQQQTIDAHVKLAWEQNIGGYDVLVVNATTLVSEIAGALAEDRPFGAVFQMYQNTRKWSLRSREGGVDVSEVAKQFGGGGHRAASGFTEKIPH